MDVQHARFVYEVQRVTQRIDAQFDESPMDSPRELRARSWRTLLSATLHILANKLDTTHPYTPRSV